MAKPVFVDDRIVAFTAVRGHYVDVGGSAPGSYTTATTAIYSEGLRIPPMRIFEEGVLNEDVVTILQANTRNSRERMGDLRSQYAGCIAAERRIVAICERYGVDTILTAMEEILDVSDRLSRSAIAAIPDGVYRFEDWCDGDGILDKPFKIAVAVTVQGDEMTIDFTGSAPQVRGGMNAPPAVTSSAAVYAVKCLTDPENISNSGSMRPITVVAPPGTVVNPLPPAPVVAGNHETASRIADVVIGALAAALPDRVCAAGSGTSGIIALGTRVTAEDGVERDAIMIESHGCGQGGNSDGDGVNARRVSVGNTGNTPNEVLESSFPISILSYSLSEDGGGAGRWRGGTGLTRVMRLEQDCTVTITAERRTMPPYGLFGGLSARVARFAADYPDGGRLELTSKTRPHRFPEGTVITVRCAGGGGYGPPEQRDVETLQDDIDDGYVSPESARELYSVDLRHDPERAEGPWVVSRTTRG
jgi:N-methylhydantoinase B